MDETGVDLVERLVAEAEPVEPARPDVLDQDVRVGQEPAEHRRAVGMAQIEPDRALVPVHGEGISGGARPLLGGSDPRRSPAAGRIAVGWLDLDHVGPQIAQEHRGVRPGEDGRAVDDSDSGEGPGRGGRRGHGADGRARRPPCVDRDVGAMMRR